MPIEDIFTNEEIRRIHRVFGPRNGNMVFGLAFRLDFMDRSGFLEDSREHFARELRRDHPERTKAKAYLQRELSDRRIIELGPGFVGDKLNNARFFEVLGASGYTGVEPAGTWTLRHMEAEPTDEEESAVPPITFVPCYANNGETVTLQNPYSLVVQDGLTYLLSQPDNSAIIFSSCVFRYDVLFNTGLPDELAAKYVRELAKQIYRVTPSSGISIHADNLISSGAFDEAGFDVELCGKARTPEHYKVEPTEETELQYLLGGGGVILRKQAV